MPITIIHRLRHHIHTRE